MEVVPENALLSPVRVKSASPDFMKVPFPVICPEIVSFAARLNSSMPFWLFVSSLTRFTVPAKNLSFSDSFLKRIPPFSTVVSPVNRELSPVITSVPSPFLVKLPSPVSAPLIFSLKSRSNTSSAPLLSMVVPPK